MDTYSFTIYIKPYDIHKDIAEDVETRFGISNCKLDRPLSEGKNKHVIELIKDELREKIMSKFVGSISKTYSYLIDDSSEHKEVKCTKNLCHKKT